LEGKEKIRLAETADKKETKPQKITKHTCSRGSSIVGGKARKDKKDIENSREGIERSQGRKKNALSVERFILPPAKPSIGEKRKKTENADSRGARKIQRPNRPKGAVEPTRRSIVWKKNKRLRKGRHNLDTRREKTD